VSEHHPLKTLRDHLPHRRGAADGVAESLEPAGEQPIPGYDQFSVAELMVEFHRHTQAELDACEAYERSHLNRQTVLNKLQYMHTHQPWQGYDEMPEDEILARLEGADDETLKRVRDYERKFGRRPPIQEAAMRLHHQRQQSAPPETPPAYQPGGGSHANL